MAGDAVLVLGATGASGICLLRELLHRKHRTIAYVRSPHKIPDDLKSNPLLEIIHGQVTHRPSLAAALARSGAVISLLGPSPRTVRDAVGTLSFLAPTGALPYPAYYADAVLPLMRERGVRRVLALSTISAAVADAEPRGQGDRFVLGAWLVRMVVRALVPRAYEAMVAVAGVFAGLREREREQKGGEVEMIEWTVFRVPMMVGGADEASWRRKRKEGNGVYAGPIRPGVWRGVLGRARLARWCVDWLEGRDGGEWKGRMPAVCDATTKAV